MKLLQATGLVLTTILISACRPGVEQRPDDGADRARTTTPTPPADKCPEGVIAMDPSNCAWHPDPANVGQRLLVCTMAESQVDPSDTAGIGTPK